MREQMGNPSGLPPGGGLEGKETFEEAAQREAREELGVTRFTLKRLWQRETNFVYIDRPVDQQEWFFLVEGDLPIISNAVEKIHSEEGILEVRWWTIVELELTEDAVFPEDLDSELGKIPH
jgi:8-oxo-dGTP pyrophosphatase MutT (NUDIX family)